jgi:hypothetical protein
MLTQLEIEINELSEMLLNNGQKYIHISELYKYLRYKEPILLKGISNYKVKREFTKLFPIHKNRRKKTMRLKLSKRQAIKNRKKVVGNLRPITSVTLDLYGISEKTAKKI